MEQYDNKIVWDLEICKNINLLKEADRVIIYGAGVKGKEILAWLKDAGIGTDFFCDMDVKKWGKYIDGVEIISPFKMKNIEISNGIRTYIIACIQYPRELCHLLEHMELNHMRIITYWGIKQSLHINAGYIYEEDSEQIALLEIEDKLRKNQYIAFGFENLRNVITTSDHAIWIIQPGKTASSSLEARLKEKGISFIKGHQLEYSEHILGETYRNIWEKSIQKRRNFKIIAAVREPLSRDYSAFWQAFTEGWERNMLMPILNKDFQQMYNSFIELIMKGSMYTKEKLGVSMPFTWNEEFEWFDEQIKKYLNIDVFQYPFDKEKGYTIIKKENIELFLFKVEKMEDVLEEISSFVGTSKLSSINTNVGEQKWYGLAYLQFRKEVKLPYEYIKHYYQGNPKMDFFYTQEEKAEFLDKWRGNMDEKYKMNGWGEE